VGILNPARILSPRRRSRVPHHIAPEDDSAHDVPRVIFHDVIKSHENLSDPTAAVDWIRRERASILDRLAHAGVVLLRGFPLENAEDFDSAVVAFNLGRFSYRESLSNAVRKDLTDRVFTANEAPPEATIRLHHELAQTPAHPRHLFFFCERAAGHGGATALCRSDDLLDRIESRHPDFIRDLVTHGLTYHHVMPGKDDPTSSMGRSWRSTLSVENRDAAEEKLTTLGYSFSWRAEEDLAVSSPCLPALLTLEDGRRSFFNQLVATRSWRDSRNNPEDALKLGDGRPVSIPLRDEIAELTESYAADLEWQRGDLALLDNHRVQHGRRPFDGRRQVLVAFGARAPTTPLTPPRPLTPVAPVPAS